MKKALNAASAYPKVHMFLWCRNYRPSQKLFLQPNWISENQSKQCITLNWIMVSETYDALSKNWLEMLIS
jgi:hypothetical protein